jgi:iron complex outermembrane receptor protein
MGMNMPSNAWLYSAMMPMAVLMNPVGALAAPDPAPAAAVDEVQEIIVTAQRRKERLQDVPIVVDAFAGDQLEEAGIKSTLDLAAVTPGLEFGTQAAYGQPFLRGVGTVANGPGVESPVALYVDGIYYGAMIGSVLTLNDIEQVEVLKGPQGTLFGRNATGGLIQITTKDPTQKFDGYVDAGYGSYNTATGDLYVTGGVTQSVAADLSVHYQNQGTGFGRNAFTNSEVNKTKDISVRSKWVFAPSDATSIKVVFDYSHQNFAQAYVPAPGTKPPGDVPYTGDPQGLNGIFDPLGTLNQGGASIQVRQDLGYAEFVSLTGFRRSAVSEAFDGGLTRDPNSVLNLVINETHTQVTQEFQLNSAAQSRLKWSTGVFLYDADGKSEPLVITTLGLFGPPPTGINNIYVFSDQKTYSAAAYAQATTEIAPATNLTAGVRYTYERRTFAISEALDDFTNAAIPGPAEESGEVSFNKVTYRLSVDHRFSSDVMGYASYNRGFKSGGFNDYLIAPTLAYAPETLDAFEIGAKTDLFERRAQLNVSLFDYEYKNIQAVEYPQGVQIIRNAAKARLYGVDVDAKAYLFGGLSLTLGGEYLHDRFTKFPDATIAMPLPGGGTAFTRGDVRGHRLGLAPDFTANLGIDYKLPPDLIPAAWGRVTTNVTYAFNDGWYAEPENRLRQPAYNVVNSSVSWSSANELNKVTLWGNNLSNSQYTVALASQDTGDFAIYAPPRTYGIKYQRKF